jgi:hypothetical protein
MTCRSKKRSRKRTSSAALQVLDDDAGFNDVALAIHQQREPAQRPAPRPLGQVPRRILPDVAELKGRAVLAQRDEHLLRVGGEGMAIERE